MSIPRALALPRSEINVTPLVDVVLVLLIIFMVITPLLDDRFHVAIPHASRSSDVPARHLVTVALLANGTMALNGAPVQRQFLEARLSELFAMGADRQVLFEASSEATYEEAAAVMDSIRKVRGSVSIAFEEPLSKNE